MTQPKISSEQIDSLDVSKVDGLAPQGDHTRNIFHNSNFNIWQRGTSRTYGAGGFTGGFHADRWAASAVDNTSITPLSTGTVVATRAGFVPNEGSVYSTKFECTGVENPLASGEAFNTSQAMEGYDVQFLKFGTADAETVTLSFWVYANHSATYTAYILDGGTSPVSTPKVTRHYLQTFDVGPP